MERKKPEYELKPTEWRVFLMSPKGKLKRPVRRMYGETEEIFPDFSSEAEAWADVERRADELWHCTEVFVLPCRRVFVKF
jgi:hypothetical protein